MNIIRGLSAISSLFSDLGPIGKAWHSDNHGHNSGLDADTVDSIEGSQIVRNDTDNTITGNNVFQGNIDCTSLPTTDPGIPGRLWNNSGTLQISL